MQPMAQKTEPTNPEALLGPPASRVVGYGRLAGLSGVAICKRLRVYLVHKL